MTTPVWVTSQVLAALARKTFPLAVAPGTAYSPCARSHPHDRQRARVRGLPNTNGSWLAKRLETLGVRVVLIATVPDELDRIVDVLQREMPRVDRLIVTGGLGGTPDDITREAVAAAFGVEQEVVPELADDLRSRFKGAPEYAARWAALPAGAARS